MKGLGAPVIGCGAIVRLPAAADKLGVVPIRSLVEFDAQMYEVMSVAAARRRASLRREV